jgi:hypothetical protein
MFGHADPPPPPPVEVPEFWADLVERWVDTHAVRRSTPITVYPGETVVGLILRMEKEHPEYPYVQIEIDARRPFKMPP